MALGKGLLADVLGKTGATNMGSVGGLDHCKTDEDSSGGELVHFGDCCKVNTFFVIF